MSFEVNEVSLIDKGRLIRSGGGSGLPDEVITYEQFRAKSDSEQLAYTGYVTGWPGSGGGGSSGILPHIIVISETGSTVTATKGTTVITATETSTGHFECDLPEFGTWTIDAILGGDDAQVSLVVDTVKVYTIDDSHFHGTVTVKYPSGATCRLQSADETLYATGSPYTFTVHHAETYTITVTYNQRIYTDTVTFTTEGQSFSKTLPSPSEIDVINDIDIWLWYGDVSGTFSTLSDILGNSTALSMLMSSTNAVDYLVRCKEWINNKVPIMTSNTTPKGTAFASSEYSQNLGAFNVFDGNDATYWAGVAGIFSNIYVGYTFETPKCVHKCHVKFDSYVSACSYKIQGSNDGTTWNDVSNTENSLDNTFTFNNSDEYSSYRLFIISETFPTSSYGGGRVLTVQFYGDDICNNQSAMSYIGLNNYCANTLLADADWCESICNSEYFESVLNVKVPTMTSDTTPSGAVTFSAQSKWNDYVHYAYKAFNGYGGAESDSWGVHKDVGGVGWVAYEFPQNVKIYKIHYKNYFTNARPTTGAFQAYNSSTTQWEDISAADLSAIQNTAEHDWCIPSGTRKTSKIKMNITGNGITSVAENWIVVDELQFYGRAAN